MNNKIAIFIGISIMFSTVLHASELKEDVKLLTEYRNRINTVAILPFKDLTETDNADIESRVAIYKGLSEIDPKKTGIEILPLDITDQRLSELGIKGYNNIITLPMKELGEKLKVDAIIVGKVLTYYSPTKDDRFINAVLGGTILGHNRARAIVECVLRLYYSPEEKEIWYKIVSGDSKPVALNIEAFATNLKAALGELSEDTKSHWPYRKRKP